MSTAKAVKMMGTNQLKERLAAEGLRLPDRHTFTLPESPSLEFGVDRLVTACKERGRLLTLVYRDKDTLLVAGAFQLAEDQSPVVLYRWEVKDA